MLCLSGFELYSRWVPLISKNIMHHLEDNNILFANQHGFWKNHSCDTKLILTVEDLSVNLDGYDYIRF